MKSNIVHQYFKKTLEEGTIIIQLDPIHLSGVELLIATNGAIKKSNREFDEEIYDDLAEDGFVETGQLEFNLYLKGLVK